MTLVLAVAVKNIRIAVEQTDKNKMVGFLPPFLF